MVAGRTAYAFRTLALLAAASLATTNVTANAAANKQHGRYTGDSAPSKGCEETSPPRIRQGSWDLQQQPPADHAQPLPGESKESAMLTKLDRQIQLENEQLKRKLIICRHC